MYTKTIFINTKSWAIIKLFYCDPVNSSIIFENIAEE